MKRERAPRYPDLSQIKIGRPRDLEASYYLRAATINKVRRSVAKPKGVDSVAFRPLTSSISIWRQYLRLPVYSFAAYVGTIAFCSLTCRERKNATVIGDQQIKSNASVSLHKTTDIHDDSTESIPSVLESPLFSTWWPPSSFLPSMPFCLELTHEGQNEGTCTTYGQAAPVEDNAESKVSGCSNATFHHVQLAVISVLPSWAETLPRLCSDMSQKIGSITRTTIPAIASNGSTTATATDTATSTSTTDVENVKSSTTMDRIGSSSEGCWDENSPLIHPKVPNQLPSLLAVPEICV